MNGAPPVLEARLVRAIHPGLALDVALRLGPECGIVFGPSGSGKTSLLRAIAGLGPIDSGRVRIGEIVIYDSQQRVMVPLRHRRIGMIDQHDLLFPHLNVAANIAFGLVGQSRRAARARVEEVAELCEVGHLLTRRPGALSGGERQRVGLARAIAPQPRLLLCDEPVSALDLTARFILIERLRAVHRSEHLPILYVTHSPAEAVALGDRLFHLREGRIVAEGTPLDVLSSLGAPFDGLRNVLRGRVLANGRDGREARVQLDGGPVVIVPRFDAAEGNAVLVTIRAEDILLALGPVEGLSARNRIEGQIVRVVVHGAEAEVVIRTGQVNWLASVVGSAVAALGLRPGITAQMIIKARSCHVSWTREPA